MENDKYCYVSVKYNNKLSKKSYYYISNMPEIKVNDKVLVNCAGEKVEGTVVRVSYYNKENVPFPLYKTKKILKILNKEENIVTETNEINNVDNSNILKDNKSEIMNNQTFNNISYNDDIEDEKGEDDDEDIEKTLRNNNKLLKMTLALITSMAVICIVIFNFNTNNITTNTSDRNNSSSSSLSSLSNNSSKSLTNSSSSSSSKSSNSSKSSTSSSSSSSSSKNYDPHKDPDVTYYSGYRKSKGVNGAVTYYCTKCNYSYQYSKGRDRGWFGCPKCGDITYKEFYEKAYPDS